MTVKKISRLNCACKSVPQVFEIHLGVWQVRCDCGRKGFRCDSKERAILQWILDDMSQSKPQKGE